MKNILTMSVEPAGFKPASLASWRVFYQLKLTTPTASSFGPPYPSRIMDRTPIGLAGYPLRDLMSKSQSYMLYGRYHCRFYFVNAFVVRGSLPGYGVWTPPASSGGWICRKSVAFYYLAAIMSRNSAVFRREDSHSPSCPGMGGTALVLLRRPSSRETVKLTKLRNVLSG